MRTERWDRRAVVARAQSLGVDEVVAETEPDRLVADRVLSGLRFAHIRGVGMPRRLSFGEGGIASEQIALYLPRSDTLIINLADSFWSDPEARMRRFAHLRFFPTANPDFPVLHELGHRSYYLVLNDPERWTALRVMRLDRTERRIVEQGVSLNAGRGPLEFVADTFAMLLDGMDYSEVIMSRYRRFGGPLP